MNTKKLTILTIVLVIGFILAACTAQQAANPPSTQPTQPPVASKPCELRVLSFGGAYDETLAKNVTAFETEFNCKVTFIASEGEDTLVRINNNEVDLIFSDPIYSYEGGDKGLFAKIDETTVPNSAKLYKIARLDDYTVIHDVGGYGIAYNPDKVSEVPDSWNDLWDPQYCDKLFTRGYRADSIELMVWVAKQNGGDERNIDPGFEAMGELAPCVHTYASDHAQILQLFQSGEVALGVWTDGRVKWAQNQGAPVKFSMPKEGGFMLVTTMNIVKSSPNLEAAYAYVNMELGEEAQVNMGTNLGYFPMNKDAYPLMSEDVRQAMGFTPDNIENAQMADWRYVQSVYDQWSERWEKEVVAKANK